MAKTVLAALALQRLFTFTGFAEEVYAVEPGFMAPIGCHISVKMRGGERNSPDMRRESGSTPCPGFPFSGLLPSTCPPEESKDRTDDCARDGV